MSSNKTTEQRFWEKVNKTDGCWLWTGSRLPRPYSYGKFRAPKAGDYAHRYSWMLHFGPIPAGLEVCHKCDNGICVNPNCLFLGTHAENMADRDRKGRARGGSKSKHSCHIPKKLTADQVHEIRATYQSRPSNTDQLASKFGVSRGLVCRIVARKIWNHI